MVCYLGSRHHHPTKADWIQCNPLLWDDVFVVVALSKFCDRAYVIK